MLVEQKFNKAIKSLQRAFDEYKDGDKRGSVGSIHFVKDYLLAVECLIDVEIKEMK